MTSMAAPAEDSAGVHSGRPKSLLFPLTLGAIGVVFGDIGTSPLYAFREALGQAGSDGTILETEILGVMSLMIWALIVIVTLKYVSFLMRADNEGEGGVLALLALAQRSTAKRGGLVLALGGAGAALFYGDAIITPALSVLSAVEGLKTIPAIGSGITENLVIGLSLVILTALFAIQSRGTAAVSRLFGPICVVWFVALGALGIYHITDQPGIVAAFLPWHAIGFVAEHGVIGLFVLGAVFLTVTGAEALTADMGHFGKVPIRLAWFALVFPALVLNYLGQGAFALASIEAANAHGLAFANQDWFFGMIPDALRLPMVILATLATIIASQAVITGAFSLTQQAIQLGLLPRMKIAQTSEGHSGQIYIGSINWLLLLGVIVLTVQFRSSSAMAAAYGIAVTGTMVITCCLAFVVTRRRWGWNLPASLAVILPFLAIDLIFFGANILRIVDGGWVPLAIGGLVMVTMWTWLRGRKLVNELESDNSVPLAEMVSALGRRQPLSAKGTAIYLTARNELTPHALLHNLKHNKVLHEHNYVTTVRVLQKPWCNPDERISLHRLDDRFATVELRYGFMEQPTVYDDLLRADGQIADAQRASFFIGRTSYALATQSAMPMWQDVLFITLHRNASDPTEWFGIPPNRVIELGTQYAI